MPDSFKHETKKYHCWNCSAACNQTRATNSIHKATNAVTSFYMYSIFTDFFVFHNQKNVKNRMLKWVTNIRKNQTVLVEFFNYLSVLRVAPISTCEKLCVVVFAIMFVVVFLS